MQLFHILLFRLHSGSFVLSPSLSLFLPNLSPFFSLFLPMPPAISHPITLFTSNFFQFPISPFPSSILESPIHPFISALRHFPNSHSEQRAISCQKNSNVYIGGKSRTLFTICMTMIVLLLDYFRLDGPVLACRFGLIRQL